MSNGLPGQATFSYTCTTKEQNVSGNVSILLQTSSLGQELSVQLKVVKVYHVDIYNCEEWEDRTSLSSTCLAQRKEICCPPDIFSYSSHWPCWLELVEAEVSNIWRFKAHERQTLTCLMCITGSGCRETTFILLYSSPQFLFELMVSCELFALHTYEETFQEWWREKCSLPNHYCKNPIPSCLNPEQEHSFRG